MLTPDLALTFAGGGNRAFYQLGLLLRWGDELLPRTRAIAACSAGACVAVTYLAGRHAEAHSFWLERRRGVTRNFDWAKLLRGQRPAPQGEIYRETLLHTLADGGLERVRAAPFPVLVLAARVPRLLPGGAAVLLGIGLYQLEKAMRKSMVHPALGRARASRRRYSTPASARRPRSSRRWSSRRQRPRRSRRWGASAARGYWTAAWWTTCRRSWPTRWRGWSATSCC
jgi:hypothetical protein